METEAHERAGTLVDAINDAFSDRRFSQPEAAQIQATVLEAARSNLNAIAADLETCAAEIESYDDLV